MTWIEGVKIDMKYIRHVEAHNAWWKKLEAKNLCGCLEDQRRWSYNILTHVADPMLLGLGPSVFVVMLSHNLICCV